MNNVSIHLWNHWHKHVKGLLSLVNIPTLTLSRKPIFKLLLLHKRNFHILWEKGQKIEIISWVILSCQRPQKATKVSKHLSAKALPLICIWNNQGFNASYNTFIGFNCIEYHSCNEFVFDFFVNYIIILEVS